MTEQQKSRPEWVTKAAEAVNALYQHQREDVGKAKSHLHASESNLKTDVREMENKVADIIHRHAQAAK